MQTTCLCCLRLSSTLFTRSYEDCAYEYQRTSNDVPTTLVGADEVLINAEENQRHSDSYEAKSLEE